MPAPRSALYLCNRARDHAGLYERDELRDGFAADEGEADRAILPSVNLALTMLSQVGFTQADFSLPTVNGTAEYDLPNTSTKIIDVSFTQVAGGNRPLREISRTQLNARARNWRGSVPGTPNVYVVNGSKIILYPIPASMGPVVIRAYAAPSDLLVETDIPTSLPVLYHDALAILAAMLLVVGGVIENPNIEQARKSGLMALWDMQDNSLTDVINARSVLKVQTRVEGGDASETNG